MIPAPLLSLALLVLWLALSRSTSLGQVLIGVVLAIVVPLLTAPLRPVRATVRRPLVIARYLFTVCRDVIASNFEVARGVLWRRPTSDFVTIPLELRDPLGLTALAIVTTVVPGTVWCELALDRSAVRLHVWHVDDVDAFIAHYKDRYERPLREIFE